MLEQVPNYVAFVFILTTALTFYLFFKALSKTTIFSKAKILAVFIVWLTLQGVLGYTGFYTENLLSLPPRFAFNIVPTIVLMVVLFNTKKGKAFIDQLDLVDLTWVSIVRIPVEIGLLLLAIHKVVPIGMTFEGWNFDIWSGITAPVIAYFFARGELSRPKLLLWNIIALTLVLTVVGQAILAVPTPFQQLSFDQPNIGVLYFPFNWLPAFIVPAVFFCHFVSIRQLILKKG